MSKDSSNPTDLARGATTSGELTESTVRFSDFDSRGYRTVDVPTGYGEWVATYENTVEDAMDIALLEELSEVPWHTIHHAVDLGCGTGRTGTWLRSKGVTSIDGVDVTPEMIAVARQRGIYQRLFEADVTATGLDAETYDLVTICLVDEHLPDVQPLYREAWRLASPGGFLVVVGYHPHFIMSAGMPTHYNRGPGEPVAIETYVHLLSEHVTAGLEAGWSLVEMKERVIDDSWLALKPKWERYRHHPISVAFTWRKPYGRDERDLQR
jgi:SAM-dependent methyltransferase